MKSWPRRAPAALLVAAVSACLVRLTVRDRWPIVDLLYYVTPWPVITGLAAAALCLLPVTRNPSRGTALLSLGLVAALPLGWMSMSSARPTPVVTNCRPSDETLDVVLWNVARGRRGFPKIASEIRASGADVIGLVEAGRKQKRERAFSGSFSGYTTVDVERGLLLLVKGEAAEPHTTRFGRRSTAASLDVVVAGRPIQVVLVDLEAYPLSRRAPLVAHVETLTAGLSRGATVIMGDFNTPHDSLSLESLEARYPPVFEGYRPTWPLPLPLLRLDHVFRSGELGVRCAEIVSSPLSDHARLHVSLTFP